MFSKVTSLPPHTLRLISALAALSLVAACGHDVVSPIAAGGRASLAGGVSTGADLQISGSSSTGSPNAGATFAYTFQVKNSGPETANNVTFTDTLPAGTGFNYAAANGTVASCAMANGVVTCDLGSIFKGSQSLVTVNLNAPVTAGSFTNTGSVSSSSVDPQPSNNAVTVTVQVKTALAACALPAGQTTVDGLVMLKYTNSFGFFENFQLQVNGVNYTVLTNFYDGSAPLTTVINLDCKQSPVQFIQVGNFVNVTGTFGTAVLPGATTATPVIYASFVQVLTHKDAGF